MSRNNYNINTTKISKFEDTIMKITYLKDTSFVSCNTLYCLTKNTGMVNAKMSNATCNRISHNIGAVITTTKTNLYDADINFLSPENIKRKYCEKLKKCRQDISTVCL